MHESLVLGPLRLSVTPLQLVLEFALPSALTILFVVVLRRMLRKRRRDDAGPRESSPPGSRRGIPQPVLKLLSRLLLFTGAVVIVALAARLLGAEISLILSSILSFLSEPVYAAGGTTISLLTIIFAVPILSLAVWLGNRSHGFLDRTLKDNLHLEDGPRFTVTNVGRYVVIFISAAIGLSIIGVNLGSFAVIFGVLGIGLGFGLQTVVANFVAGLVVLFSRIVKEGDRILIGDNEATVVRIKLLSTIINTLRNETIIIPNQHLVNNQVYNYSYEDTRIIVVNDVQVSYGSDLDRVGEALRRVGERNPWRIAEQEPFVVYKSFDDSGITVGLHCWIRAARDRVRAFSWTNLEIWREFRDSGVEIPFPQVDLHVKDTPAARKHLSGMRAAPRIVRAGIARNRTPGR